MRYAANGSLAEQAATRCDVNNRRWTDIKLRFVASFNPSRIEALELDPATEVSFVPMNAIGDDGSLQLDETKPISEIGQGYTFFANGDVVIAKITPCFENGKGAFVTGLSNGKAFGTTELIVVRPDQRRSVGRFLHWLFTSPDFRSQATAAMYGAGGQKRVPDDFVKDFTICLPTIVEQAEIAAFLNRETAKIDDLIAEQERLIALLEEKRQAVISHAVTKGLDPNANSTSCNQGWLKEIPVHWAYRKLTALARLETGHTPSRQHSEYWAPEDCIIPWFTLADVNILRDGRTLTVFSTSEKISQIGIDNSAARLLPIETVILSRTASVGFSGIIDVPMAVSQDFAAWICGPQLRPKYLLFCLRSMYQEFRRLMFGSTHKTIYMPDIQAFRIPLPPIQEQDEIVSFIEGAVGTVDAMLDESWRLIILLKERRAALISAAVTGKIDVRSLVDNEALLPVAAE